MDILAIDKIFINEFLVLANSLKETNYELFRTKFK